MQGLRVDSVTASAFLNTDIAASFAAVTWLFVEWARGRQPKFVGLLTGAVAGLATITPAARYVSPITAIVFGMLWLISRVTVTKVDREAEERGLDLELHGEEAFSIGVV